MTTTEAAPKQGWDPRSTGSPLPDQGDDGVPVQRVDRLSEKALTHVNAEESAAGGRTPGSPSHALSMPCGNHRWGAGAASK